LATTFFIRPNSVSLSISASLTTFFRVKI
jgi:hypothetical protein